MYFHYMADARYNYNFIQLYVCVCTCMCLDALVNSCFRHVCCVDSCTTEKVTSATKLYGLCKGDLTDMDVRCVQLERS